MSQILAAFNAETVVEKTLRLMAQSKIYEQFAYRYNLRSVTVGWTLDARKTYFKWFNEDHADDQHRYDYREWFNRVNQQPRIAGNGPYLNQLRTAAVATLTDAEKAAPSWPRSSRPTGRRHPAGAAAARQFLTPRASRPRPRGDAMKHGACLLVVCIALASGATPSGQVQVPAGFTAIFNGGISMAGT